jgi:hypothetical protein
VGCAPIFAALSLGTRFQRDFKKAPPEVQEAVDEILKELRGKVAPKERRFHSLKGTNPKILSSTFRRTTAGK